MYIHLQMSQNIFPPQRLRHGRVYYSFCKEIVKRCLPRAYYAEHGTNTWRKVRHRPALRGPFCQGLTRAVDVSALETFRQVGETEGLWRAGGIHVQVWRAGQNSPCTVDTVMPPAENHMNVTWSLTRPRERDPTVVPSLSCEGGRADKLPGWLCG